jgi:hypothetical protein
MPWRDQFALILWDHFYILDANAYGVQRAREEARVVPAVEFEDYMRKLCEQAEKEGAESVKRRG